MLAPHLVPAYISFRQFSTITEIIEAFELGKLITVGEQDTGNLQTEIKTDKDTYFLKEYPKSSEDPAHYATKIFREIRFTELLSHNGLHVPQVVNFQPFLFNGKLHTLLKRPTTQSLKAPNTDESFRFGIELAKMHGISEKIKTPEIPFEHRAIYTDSFLPYKDKLKEQLDWQKVLDFSEQYAVIRREVETLQPQALINAESTWVIVQKSENGDIWFVDFELCKKLPLVFDFLPAIAQIFTKENAFQHELLASFIEGYKAEHEINGYGDQLIIAYKYHLLAKISYSISRAATDESYVPIAKGRMESYENDLKIGEEAAKLFINTQA